MDEFVVSFTGMFFAPILMLSRKYLAVLRALGPPGHAEGVRLHWIVKRERR